MDDAEQFGLGKLQWGKEKEEQFQSQRLLSGCLTAKHLIHNLVTPKTIVVKESR